MDILITAAGTMVGMIHGMAGDPVTDMDTDTVMARVTDGDLDMVTTLLTTQATHVTIAEVRDTLTVARIAHVVLRFRVVHSLRTAQEGAVEAVVAMTFIVAEGQPVYLRMLFVVRAEADRLITAS